MIISAKPILIHENRCEQAQPKVGLLFHILFKWTIMKDFSICTDLFLACPTSTNASKLKCTIAIFDQFYAKENIHTFIKKCFIRLLHMYTRH